MPDISVSFSNDTYRKEFKGYVHFTAKKGLFEDLALHMTREVWSPVVWEPGYRRDVNFKETHLIGLDFDDGELTLSDAIDYFKALDISCVIGTTRSHQIPKRKNEHVIMPACDRFRVILAAEKCTSLADYSYTNSVFMENLPCDQSCKDGARYFAPCKEIVWTNFTGKLASWIKAPPKRLFIPKNYSKGQMPLPISSLINNGPLDNEGRHKSCYKVGAQLSVCGYSETEIIKMIMKGPMGAIGLKDVERAVRNGIEKAQGDWK